MVGLENEDDRLGLNTVRKVAWYTLLLSVTGFVFFGYVTIQEPRWKYCDVAKGKQICGTLIFILTTFHHDNLSIFTYLKGNDKNMRGIILVERIYS